MPPAADGQPPYFGYLSVLDDLLVATADPLDAPLPGMPISSIQALGSQGPPGDASNRKEDGMLRPLLLTAALLLSCVPARAGENLIQGGDFEQGLTGWQ